jgi:DNA replication protein DnaC
MSEFQSAMDRIMARQREMTPEQIEAWNVHTREREAEEERRVQRQIAENIAITLRQMELPIKDLELAKSGQVKETEATRALAEGVTIVVLSGAPGCGKTTAAVCWLYDGATSQRSIGGIFVSAAKLSRWARYNEKEMDRLLETRRLVIDDLGAEYLDEKGAYMSLLDEVVNERYANKRTTVLTTNLDAAAFKLRYGERIADRIRESGKFVSVGGASMRRKAT